MQRDLVATKMNRWQDERRFSVVDRRAGCRRPPMPRYKQRRLDRARRSALVQAITVARAGFTRDLLDLMARNRLGA